MSRSRLRAALGHVWVRAVLLAVSSAVLIPGLYLLGAMELDGGGHSSLGGPLLKIDFFVVIAAFFLGPAWVIAPTNRPHGDGPPRGGIVPIPLKVPEQVEAAEDEAPPAAA